MHRARLSHGRDRLLAMIFGRKPWFGDLHLNVPNHFQLHFHLYKFLF